VFGGPTVLKLASTSRPTRTFAVTG